MFDNYSLTDIGSVRAHNEDKFGAFPEIGLWIVCDGMGGHDAGEVASEIAVESVSNSVKAGVQLEDAILNAHQDILNAPQKNIGRPGMGTTIVVVQFNGANYKVCWVGDSRAYLWDGELHQLTHDHSYVQDLIDAGILTDEAARKHPQRNVITQALGASLEQKLDVGCVKGLLKQDQTILLCSDGLTGELTDKQIEMLLGEKSTLKDCADRMLNQAIEKGGTDNITLVLIRNTKRSKTAPRRATMLDKQP